MRCRNCGWENDLGAFKCEKCNAPLSGSMVENNQYAQSEPARVPEVNLNKTVREVGAMRDANDSMEKCPNCGYLYSLEMGNCPNCGNSGSQHSSRPPEFKKEREEFIKCPVCQEMVPSKFNFCANCGKPFKMGTVNPWAKRQSEDSCSLTPMAWEGEDDKPAPNNYLGETVVLNRDNTDPGNNSITSAEQAILTRENGEWYIEDRSQMQTTYIHVSKKTKLEDGAIVLLGNRRFIFKK